MIRLIIEDDEGGVTTVPLEQSEVTIGREEGNNIRLTERNVSRRHARLILENGACFIEDLDSYNGVRVNGERITRKVRIVPGDLVSVGDYRLSIQMDQEETPPPLAKEVGATEIEIDQSRRKTVEMQAPPDLPPPPIAPADTPPPPAVPIRTSPAPKPEEEVDKGGRKLKEASDKDISTADTAVIRYKGKPSQEQSQAADSVVPGMPDPPARLVCLVPPFEGEEFKLSRPELVIGRDQSCDIALDHRSVDEHHAKITFQEGTYSVVDLGSHDGVKVNDETYRIVTLRKGDIITIGSLRFRFVAPGEDFNFVPGIDEAEKFVEVAASRRLSKPVLAGMASGAIVLAVVVYFVAGTGSNHVKDVPPDNKMTARTNASDTGGTTPEGDDEVSKALEKGREAFRNENWTLAMASFKTVLEKNPGNEEARTLLDKAASEQSFAARYDECRDMFEAGKLAKAFETCKQIPETSRYSERAQKLLPEIKKEFIKKHLDAARTLVNRRRFSDASDELKQVAIFDPNNEEAAKIKKLILNRKAGVKIAARQTKLRKNASTKKRRGSRSTENARERAKRIYLEATKKHLQNKIESAIELYKKALKTYPGFALAYRGLGSAYASLGNGRMACLMYKRYMELAPNAPDYKQVKAIIKGCK